jgi:predicted DNA-binding ribbon-helix-helix protein
MTPPDLVTTINSKRKHNNLSSAIRLFVLDHYRRQAVPLLKKRGALSDELKSRSRGSRGVQTQR